jgi:hypothetical protein
MNEATKKGYEVLETSRPKTMEKFQNFSNLSKKF